MPRYPPGCSFFFNATTSAGGSKPCQILTDKNIKEASAKKMQKATHNVSHKPNKKRVRKGQCNRLEGGRRRRAAGAVSDYGMGRGAAGRSNSTMLAN